MPCMKRVGVSVGVVCSVRSAAEDVNSLGDVSMSRGSSSGARPSVVVGRDTSIWIVSPSSSVVAMYTRGVSGTRTCNLVVVSGSRTGASACVGCGIGEFVG